MAQLFQFDDNQQGRRPLCIACEEMLTDALDHTLSGADQTWFDRHVESCSDCSRMVADAQRGAAWLEMLKAPRPEPSAALLERILAQTSGAQTSGAQTSGLEVDPSEVEATPPRMPHLPGLQPGSMPIEIPSNLLSFRPRVQKFASWVGSGFGSRAGASFEPRLAMTAAMAFFSIALTLNLAGVRLDQLRARDLSPTKVRQSYYEASAEAVRYYDNLRAVRLVESRVEQVEDQNLKGRDDLSPAAAQPGATPAPQGGNQVDKTNKTDQNDKKDGQKPGGGTSSIQSPFIRPRFQQVAERSSKSQEGGLV